MSRFERNKHKYWMFGVIKEICSFVKENVEMLVLDSYCFDSNVIFVSVNTRYFVIAFRNGKSIVFLKKVLYVATSQ